MIRLVPLLALGGCLVNTALRDERLEALEACEAVAGFADADGDGFGDLALTACPEEDPDWVDRGGDCDDTDPDVAPFADEHCDGVDEDCDGNLDEEAVDALTTWVDGDGDGWGEPGTERVGCEPPGPGRTDRGGDCADADPSRFPGAPEWCNEVDDDCDGATDEVGAVDGFTVYADADGDGFGDPNVSDSACVVGPGWSASPLDCDDGLPLVNPAGSDTPLVDGDCDGVSGTVGQAAREVYGVAGEYAGTGVGGAGDFDGDGLADWAVGSPGTDVGLTYDHGAVWVVPGASGPGQDATLTSHAWSFTGEYAGHLTGAVLRAGGDVNGDGFDDLLVGSVASNGARGGAWVVWGSAAPVSGSLTTYPELIGELVGDEAGAAVATTGDLDFDGRNDLMVGAPGADRVYLLSGGDWSGDWDLSVAEAILEAPQGARLGEGLDGVGDVDGDGTDDLAVGAPELTGAVSLVSGYGLSGTLDVLAVATRTWLGENVGDRAGAAIAAAGDVDADGYADVLVGAPERLDGAVRPGGAYLILGRASFAAPGGLATTGSVIVGAADADRAGGAVDGAGDVDGDGHPDLIVGAPGHAGGEGRAVVILGSTNPAAVVDLAVDGVAIGADIGGNVLGVSVAGVGDTNGDGWDDVVVGAPLHDHGVRVDSGAGYLVFGQAL